MKHLIHNWQVYWTIVVILIALLIIPADIIAVKIGHKDHIGDQLTLTHWLVVYVGISAIGAFIGYLIAHFLFVHIKG